MAAAGMAVSGGALDDDLGLGKILRGPPGADPQGVQLGGQGAHFLTDQFHLVSSFGTHKPPQGNGHTAAAGDG